MRDILKAEWLRYRSWSLLFAVVHLLALAFFMRLADPGQQPLNVYRLIGAFYALIGILLGLHQMGTWRRPNQWLNLLHRPVAEKRIAAGLLGGGVTSLVVAIAVPLLIALAGQAWGTARVVEARHHAVPVAALAVAISGYLAGAYGALADRRYAACGLVFLLWIFASQASGLALIGIQCAACLWLLAMVLVAFRPDLGAPPRSVIATLVVALPTQMAVYLLLLLAGFIGQLLWIMQGTHPVNMATPPAGGYVETERMTARDRLLAGLAGASSPDVALWREQVALSEVYTLDRQSDGMPVRNAMTNDVPTTFDDDEARIHWTFSHQRMRFEGMHIADGTNAGELGAGHLSDAFDAIAMPAGVLPGMAKGDVALFAGNTLYQYMSAARRIVPRLAVGNGELLLGTTMVSGSMVAMTDRAVYVFDGRHLVDGTAPLVARQRVPVPGASGDLWRAEFVELVDGYLLSFTFSRHAYDMLGTSPYQTVLWVNDAGQVTPVATRALGADFPTFYRYRSSWASPVMCTLADVAVSLFDHPGPYERYATPGVPSGMRMLAGGLLLASLLAGAWLCWRRDMSWPRRMGWVLACGLVGIPAVVSLALIVPRAARQAVRTPRTARAAT